MRNPLWPNVVDRPRPRSRKTLLLCLLILGGTSGLAYAAPPQSKKPGSTVKSGNRQGGAAANPSTEGNIAPIRTIRDRYPMFAGVAVDPVNDKAVFSDDNTYSLLTYDRAVPSSGKGVTEYRERIVGPKTGIARVCGVAMDPVSREIYMDNTDGTDDLLAFPKDSRKEAGFQLGKIQAGLEPNDWKPFKEIRIKDSIGIYRVLYVAKFEKPSMSCTVSRRRPRKQAGRTRRSPRRDIARY